MFAIEWRLYDEAWTSWRAKLVEDYENTPTGAACTRSVGVRVLLEGGVQLRTDDGVLFPPDRIWQEHEQTSSEDSWKRWAASMATGDEPLTANAADVVADAGYVTACSVHTGRVRGGDDLLLPRVPVNGSGSLLTFGIRLVAARSAQEMSRRFARPLHGRVKRLRAGIPS